MTHEELQLRIDGLRLRLEQLDRIPQRSYEEFSSDFRNLAATIYLLQASIQALIDLGSWLVARLGLPTPRRSMEVFEHLEEAGHLPAGTAARFAPIVGFRNRVVHLYDRIDEAIVYDILVDHRRDPAELLDRLLDVEA